MTTATSRQATSGSRSDAGKTPLLAARTSVDECVAALRQTPRLPDPLTGAALKSLAPHSSKHVLQTFRLVGLIDVRSAIPSTELHTVSSKGDDALLRSKILSYLPTIVGSIQSQAQPAQVSAAFAGLSGQPSSQDRCKRLILSFLKDEGVDIDPYRDDHGPGGSGSAGGRTTAPLGPSSTGGRTTAPLGPSSTGGREEEQSILRQSLVRALDRDSLSTADWIWERLNH
jgi:hypothetical protein